jgi:type I restriction enzyme S subunit
VVKPGQEDVENGVLFVRGGDIKDGKINTLELRTITQETSKPYSRTLLRGGEMLISLVGNPGEVAIVPQELAGANIARQAGLVALRPEFHSRFIMYFLRSPIGRAELFQRTKGAVQQVINLADLKTVNVPQPDLPTQECIAAVLSAYDDLIENNRQRIALLEQAARLLYREWFVHFRFPGHETAKFVDGLPEGWEFKLLPEVCVDGNGIQTGPFGSQLHQSDYTEDGVPVIMPKNIKGNTIDCDGIARIPEALADKLGRHRMMVGDTVYGRRGEIGRRAFIGPKQEGFFCGTGCLRIRPNTSVIDARFLFETLGAPDTAGFIVSQARGSTMPNLSAGALKQVPILYPPLEVQEAFKALVTPKLDAAEVLDTQNTKLTRARDLLLPRLMDGRLPV